MSLTLGQALRAAGERLARAGIDSPALDARLLLAEATGFAPPALALHAGEPLTELSADHFAALIERRERREPVSHILGRRGFWTLDLAVTPATLDPRPDSETVIEAVLAESPQRTAHRRLLDLGTGSGCLLLALLAELPAATGLGIDRSPAALAVAQANAEACGLAGRAAFREGDWGSWLEASFDVIVSNPPYIPTAEIDQLAPEVAQFEPRSALDGGLDGLDAYRRLAPDLVRLLRPGGLTVLEVGHDQAAAVTALLAAAGLQPVGTRSDLGGFERCVLARKGLG